MVAGLHHTSRSRCAQDRRGVRASARGKKARASVAGQREIASGLLTQSDILSQAVLDLDVGIHDLAATHCIVMSFHWRRLSYLFRRLPYSSTTSISSARSRPPSTI